MEWPQNSPCFSCKSDHFCCDSLNYTEEVQCIWIEEGANGNGQCITQPESCTICNNSLIGDEREECCDLLNNRTSGQISCIYIEDQCFDMPTTKSDACEFCHEFYNRGIMFQGHQDCCNKVDEIFPSMGSDYECVFGYEGQWINYSPLCQEWTSRNHFESTYISEYGELGCQLNIVPEVS